MLDDITQIQANIEDIQARIAALSPPPVPLQAAPASFAKALGQAQAAGGEGPAAGGVAVPPASLGPLPVSPGAPGVTPLPVRVSDAGDYDALIRDAAARNGVDPSLVRAVIQTESGGDPRAVSSAGAMGLMQLMPANVLEAGVSDPFDPVQNITAGTQQLAGLLKQYHGDLNLALAAYNAGPANVRKYGGVPPFGETQNYIRKVRAAMQGGKP